MSTPTVAVPGDDELIAAAEALAADLLVRAERLTAPSERRRAHRLAALLSDDRARDLLLDLTDQVLRIRDPRRAARRLRNLAADGIPAALGTVDRLGLALLGRLGPAMPAAADHAVDWRIDKDMAGVILPADDPAFARYVRDRHGDGFRLNINVLGESILGDGEADARCAAVLDRIRRPDVDYVSVKISAVCANLDVLAEEDSLARIAERLRLLYRAAAASATFVNLDMEEYRDLELTLRSFMSVLDDPEFADLTAGIVLQTYIPDSHAGLDRLCQWANQRHARGCAGIKIRLVKGANLAMEKVEGELHGWAQAPYGDKAEVDASFKRMLEQALLRGDPGAVRVGVASHNLFEVAYALTLATALRAADRVDIEMLEGMAPPQARAVREVVGDLLLYSPVVSRADREASIAYLSRRLDENSAPENFLRSLFDITPGSVAWRREAERFRASVRDRHDVSTASRRSAAPAPAAPATDAEFANAPDSDLTVASTRARIAAALATTIVTEPALVTTVDAVDDLLVRTVRAQEEGSAVTWQGRRDLLAGLADLMESERPITLALMARTAGKTVGEGDPEVSEAIDFARYAAHLTRQHERLAEADSVTWRPHRVVVVAGPWNFPYAIPASGLVHAFAAGCGVVLKPAPETRVVAAHLVDQCHRAGIPPHLVQLACTPDDEVGQHLVTHDDVDLVMLTGSRATATMFLGWRPAMRLHAETSGKNALVITAAADLDQAIKDLVRSAFGHAGQKCSAASLAIVEASVYDDPAFHRRLSDAVTSLRVGSPMDPATRVGPLVEPPGPDLLRALTTLDDGERWLVPPRQAPGDPTLWSPGVRVGVRPGSWFHRTECFGPVLGVMRAADLDDAIAMQNGTDYGLTGGLHSLDPREIRHWLDRVHVGNAYVNRHITGAVVRRQPFGGWKASSIGGGAKPGGPNHLHGYGQWSSTGFDEEQADRSFRQAWSEHYSRANDPSALACESNVLRYRPLASVLLVAADPDARRLAELAAAVCGVRLSVVDDDDAVIAAMAAITDPAFSRIRAPHGASAELLVAAQARAVVVDRSPITGSGYAELPHWLLEQSVSRTMHRYGRLLRPSG